MPEERQITTKEEMLDDICATLGGRAAEDLCIGRISTGAMNDLEKVTKRSYGMIAYAGMSDSLPNLCYYNNEEYAFTKPYSDHTAQLIDEEVKKLIAEQYERAKQILREHKEGHEELAQLLIDREVIYAEDVERIFGKRPWVSRTEEILAANANQQPLDNAYGTDHSAENEEFIRKKVVEAVVEKAKKGELIEGQNIGKVKEGEENAKEEKHEPKQFHELKVTTFETSTNEDVVTDELDSMEPFELIDPIETNTEPKPEPSIDQVANKQDTEPQQQAGEEGKTSTDPHEQTLFGW